MGISRLMKQHKAVFFDRDGVLNNAIIKNDKPYPPATVSELIIPADAKSALEELKAAGFLLIGATNQPDVARGTTERSVVEAINAKLLETLPLEEIRVCYHDDADQCACRKPLPGLMLQAAQDFNINLCESIMVGDRWKDIEAGQKAGCKTIWLNRHYQEKAPSVYDYMASTISEAANWILSLAK